MTELERICDQMKRGFAGPAWYGPALVEVLKDVDARRAAARAGGTTHSIWQVVLHLAYGQQVVLRRVRGENAAWDLTADWPEPRDASEAEWERTIEALAAGEEVLRREVARLPAGDLDVRIMPDGTSLYVNLQGYVQHLAYHAGQIAVLRKSC
jgi:uncharacterized damage-inducible protein DinB